MLCHPRSHAVNRHLPIISERANPTLVLEVLAQVAKNNIKNVSHPEFAYALGSEIVRIGAGIAATFLVSYVGVVMALLFIARIRLRARKDESMPTTGIFGLLSKALR
jgi:hypothetical protein